MKITVIFEERKGYLYVYLCVQYPFCTLSHQITPLQHDFLQNFPIFCLCPKESATMLAYVLTTWHVMLFEMVGLTEFDGVLAWQSQQFPNVLSCWALKCHFGWSTNMTQFQHSQLRLLIHHTEVGVSFLCRICLLYMISHHSLLVHKYGWKYDVYSDEELKQQIPYDRWLTNWDSCCFASIWYSCQEPGICFYLWGASCKGDNGSKTGYNEDENWQWT